MIHVLVMTILLFLFGLRLGFMQLRTADEDPMAAVKGMKAITVCYGALIFGLPHLLPPNDGVLTPSMVLTTIYIGVALTWVRVVIPAISNHLTKETNERR